MFVGKGLPLSLQSLAASSLPGVKRGTAPSISDLEKHLDDYRKGKGNLSKDTAVSINETENSLFRTLSTLDPRSTLNLGAYATALNYSQRSRYMTNLSEMTDGISQVQKAYQLSKIG